MYCVLRITKHIIRETQPPTLLINEYLFFSQKRSIPHGGHATYFQNISLHMYACVSEHIHLCTPIYTDVGVYIFLRLFLISK